MSLLTLFIVFILKGIWNNHSGSIEVNHASSAQYTSTWLPTASAMPVTLSEQKMADGSIAIVSENKEYRPYTLEISWKVQNVKIPKTTQYLVPGKVKNFTLFTIKPTSPAYSYAYKFKCIPGDLSSAKHDNTYVYSIPFQRGYQTKVSQGYNGSYSHMGVNAIDFVAPVGTPVCAARAGIVVEVVESNSSGCASSKCMQMANFIKILHSDGSEALYSHLKHNGSKVSEGQEVAVGEVIGYSGNTGWTTNPHLHFEVLIPDMKGGKSVSTQFRLHGENKTLSRGDLVQQAN